MWILLRECCIHSFAKASAHPLWTSQGIAIWLRLELRLRSYVLNWNISRNWHYCIWCMCCGRSIPVNLYEMPFNLRLPKLVIYARSRVFKVVQLITESSASVLFKSCLWRIYFSISSRSILIRSAQLWITPSTVGWYSFKKTSPSRKKVFGCTKTCRGVCFANIMRLHSKYTPVGSVSGR